MHVRIEAMLRVAGVASAGVLCLATFAAAEPPPEREWDLAIGAYGWLTAADLKVEGRHRFTDERTTRHFHQDLGDAFENADGGFGGYIDGRYKRFVALLDGVWVQSEYDDDDDDDGWQTSTIADAKIGFRVLDIPRPFSHSTGVDGPRFHLDLMAGARYHNSDADVGSDTLDYDQSRDWWSPLIGLRWGVELIPNLTFATVADIGGFDVWDASHLTWSVNPRLNYRAWEHLDLFIGWKHLADDRDSERDINLNGPQAGIGYSF